MINTYQATREAFAILRRNTEKSHASRVRHRDIAEKLHISEGELIAAHVGRRSETPSWMLHAIRLRPEWPEIIAALEPLGTVMALTRNTSCVHEKIGVYCGVSHHHQVGLVLGPDIDLRLFYENWVYGFSVCDQLGQKIQYSLQFFDAAGTAVHKIMLRPESDQAAYDALVAQFASAEQSVGILPQAGAAPLVERPDAEIDIKEFHRAWDTLRDTHDFMDFLRHFALSRTQALRLAEAKYACPVGVGACRKLLQSSVAQSIAIMVFVVNPGMIQIHTGPVHQVSVIGSWLNVLDAGFNLHLREDHIASAWIVRKPTIDGVVTSLELFDARGDIIALFFGARKQGKPELDAWRALTDDLCHDAESCVAI